MRTTGVAPAEGWGALNLPGGQFGPANVRCESAAVTVVAVLRCCTARARDTLS